MVAEASASLRHAADAQRQIHLDLRYVGQEFTLQVPVTVAQLETGDRDGIRAAFDALYEHRYAHHSPDEPVEMVNIRLAMIGKRPKLSFPRLGVSRGAKPSHLRDVYFVDAGKAVPSPVYPRGALGAGETIAGPALIQEHGTTTVLFEQDACTVAPSGEMIITVGTA
jgi:N-methylhydantoinase A